jgi:hypothetical protein
MVFAHHLLSGASHICKNLLAFVQSIACTPTILISLKKAGKVLLPITKSCFIHPTTSSIIFLPHPPIHRANETIDCDAGWLAAVLLLLEIVGPIRKRCKERNSAKDR